ncbi:MAG TPA: hypothetical protein VFQ60_01805 [Patescibacteria group bacterium]|nr:hypothetical protein [Patescibacteria group bacterium]
MPSHPLENPFHEQRKRDSDRSDFFGTVLGSKEKNAKKHKTAPVEDWNEKLNVSEGEQNTIEEEKIISDLMEQERLALRKFFGKEIHVPPLPPEITVEKIKAWEALDLRLHYLPPENLAEIKRDENGTIIDVQPKNFPGWKKKPENWFFKQIKDGKLPPRSAQLPGAWVLIDSRSKPVFRDGIQKYPNDFLGPSLEELNKKGIIEQRANNGTHLDVDSRYGISADELSKKSVRKAVAQAMNIPEEYVSLPRAIEFNILGNIYYLEWGETNTAEIFEDRFNGVCLVGGCSRNGGLSQVRPEGKDDRYLDLGFRVMGRFFDRG